MEFNSQETATIIAALRGFQEEVRAHGIADVASMYDHFQEVDPLNESEIDRLCEKINLG